MNSFASLLKTLACTLLLFAAAINVHSQQSTGSLKGTVKDQLGALVVGASIVVKDGKHSERTVTSDDNGNYEVRSLAPGRYDLTIKAAGFNTVEEKNVELRAGKTSTLNVELTIGMLEQTVVVDNTGVSTDADRNADAVVLRERELAALPDDPEALAAALQAMDPNPGPGQTIIPRNFAQGPTFFSVNFGASKSIKFGRAIEPKAPPAAAAGTAQTVNAAAPAPAPATGQKPAARPPVQRPYTLVFGVYVSNALNHTNASIPVGNMTSPFFLRSTSTSSYFFFGPGGGGGASGNRQIVARVRLSF